MYAIAHAESSGRQVVHNRGLNRNGTVDFGYFGINSIHREKGETVAQFETRMYDLEENFKLAQHVLKIQGITAWSTYNNKKYLAYYK